MSRRDVNRVILIGNLRASPILDSPVFGNQIARASIATDQIWRDRQSGGKRKRTQWHDLVFRGDLAIESSGRLFKGANVYIEGRVVTNESGNKEVDVRQFFLVGDPLSGGSCPF